LPCRQFASAVAAMDRSLLAFFALATCAVGEGTGQCGAPGAAAESSCQPRQDLGDEAASVLQVKGRDKTLDSAHRSEADAAQLGARGSRLIVKNGCRTAPMWIASMFREEDRARYPNNVKLEPGETLTFDFPTRQTVVATRFWPKMGCDADGQHCRLGSSGGPGQTCPRTGCAPPVDTKFEATWWDFNTAEPVDWWDTSGVDGYTVPYTLELDSNCPQGRSLDCSTLSMADCPSDEVLNGKKVDLNLRFEGNSTGERVGCYSPCGKLTFSNWGNQFRYSPAALEARHFCCPTPPESVEACRSGPVEKTKFVHLFRQKCRDVYSYAYDDAMGLQTCPVGTTYRWTLLCPLGDNSLMRDLGDSGADVGGN